MTTLVQNVADWTHLRDTQNPSRLDLVFTKIDRKIEDVKSMALLSLSMQAVLCFMLAADTKPQEQESDSQTELSQGRH